MLYMDTNIQLMVVAEMFAINLFLVALWLFFPVLMLFFSGLFCPGNGTCIPGLAISDLGAKAGSEGLKRWDCSPCTTCLFSASYEARPFQTVPHSSELNRLRLCLPACAQGHRYYFGLCMRGNVLRALQIWWSCLIELWNINTGSAALLFPI